MTISRGAIWQQLRRLALDSIPLGSRIDYREPLTLRSWESQGTYLVDRAESKNVVLIVYSDEFGGALLTEVEHYLDHAAEHQVTVWQQLASGGWQSKAWQLVTIYYWAYYLAMAWTRLLGRTVWYVDQSVARKLSSLSQLAQNNAPRFGAGTFSLSCEMSVSATNREVCLRKASGRLHDQLWRTCFQNLRDILGSVAPTSGSEEERLFRTLCETAQILGPDWPSSLRNLFNYRPGFAYCAVRQGRGSVPFHDPKTYRDFSDLLNDFEDRVATLDRAKSLDLQAGAASRALVGMTFVLAAIVREIYEETLERKGIDSRWRMQRERFLALHGVLVGSGRWPA